MSLIETDTGLISSGYLDYSSTYKTGGIDVNKNACGFYLSKTTVVLICHMCGILLGKSN